MTQKSITIKASLDARQAAYFVQTAGKFESEIQVSVDEKRINAKSIMGTIALNMQEGQTALITADAKDEAAAVEELAAVLAYFFYTEQQSLHTKNPVGESTAGLISFCTCVILSKQLNKRDVPATDTTEKDHERTMGIPPSR